MLRALAALLGLPRRRSLEAAGGGRRWRDAPLVNSPGVIHGGASTVAARALHYALNNAQGARIVESLASNIIGDGIKPRSTHSSEAARKALHRAFANWTDAADADGRTDFYGLQTAAVRDMAIHGEGLFSIAADPASGAPTLRRLHPEQLDRSWTRRLASGAIHQGVEFDAAGRIVAYHIRPGMSGELLAGISAAPARIPASDIIHIFRQITPGQVRGLSWFAPVLLAAKELDALNDALIVRAKVAALHAGFITDADGTGAPYDKAGAKPDEASLEPGAMIRLDPGKSIEFPAVPDQGDTAALMTATLRAIAAGVNVTYEQATGDYSQVNYSSARAALLEFRRFCAGVQHHNLIFGFCRPVWQRFVRWRVLRGDVSAAAYVADRAAVEAVKWLPPAWPWVDPLKDANAAVVELKSRIRSRSEIIAERGYDAEDVDREIAADAQRLRELGVAADEAAPGPDPLLAEREAA